MDVDKQVTFRNRYPSNMVHWLLDHDFVVGLPESDFEEHVSIKFQRLWAEILTKHFDFTLLGKLAVTGKPARAEEVAKVVRPAIDKADIIAFKLALICQMIPVLSGDALSSDQIKERLRFYLQAGKELRKLGERMMLLPRQILVTPLIIFFEERQYQSKQKELIPALYQVHAFKQAYLLGALVDVSNQSVHYPKSSLVGVSKTKLQPMQPRGIFHQLSRSITLFGGVVLFNNHDMLTVSQME
jgi:hypothetical protein